MKWADSSQPCFLVTERLDNRLLKNLDTNPHACGDAGTTKHEENQKLGELFPYRRSAEANPVHSINSERGYDET